jgi:hypothetical protein
LAHPLRPATQQAIGVAFPRAVACLVAGWQFALLASALLA